MIIQNGWWTRWPTHYPYDAFIWLWMKMSITRRKTTFRQLSNRWLTEPYSYCLDHRKYYIPIDINWYRLIFTWYNPFFICFCMLVVFFFSFYQWNFRLWALIRVIEQIKAEMLQARVTSRLYTTSFMFTLRAPPPPQLFSHTHISTHYIFTN